MTSRPRDVPFFFARNLVRWGLAEVTCQLGNLAPGVLARRLWRLALWLNEHHEVAAANLAKSLADASSSGAWAAFVLCLAQLENRHEISASDLYLSRWPGRLARLFVARWLWGSLGAAHPLPAVHDGHDAVLQTTLRQLARHHVAAALATEQPRRARRAYAAWRSLAGKQDVEVRWAAVEIAWTQTEGFDPRDDENLQELLRHGAFVSPLDCLRWGERFLERGHLEEARSCFKVARSLLPEEAATWRGMARLVSREDVGSRDSARHYWRRSLSREPQDVMSFLAHLALDGQRTMPAETGCLLLEATTRLEINDESDLVARLEDVADPTQHTLHILPPAGWGIVANPRQVSFDAQGRASTRLVARRPHRLQDTPWKVLALAVGPDGYRRAELSIEVTDSSPGQVLLTVTEDHEIHEERGVLDPEMLHKVLVDKSRAAADLGVPWTHMVEVGSVLSMPPAAVDLGDRGKGEAWQRLWIAVRRHLVEEVARGHDLQPHLHTFNDPAYDHFPYTMGEQGWQPSLPFLLTEAQRRGDFSTVCPPPGHPQESSCGWDRLQSVERAVAQLESVGRLGNADYRPLLWRSGLLEYGSSEADRAWSAVALRRAGLLADSDLIQPLSDSETPRAFMAGWLRPFVVHHGGPLLQLPIVANLEGGYMQGRRRLRRQAKGCLDAVRGRPGVHLFTVLTHDKFINARRGRDEFRLDPDYGDWPVIRDHLAAWKEGGAEIVTAAEGVRRVIDDTSWHLHAVLRQETFVADLPDGQRGVKTDVIRVQYRVELLGHGIEVSEDYPQQVWVSIPCSWRSGLRDVEVRQGDRQFVVTDREMRGFWIELTSVEDPVDCVLEIEDAAGKWPRIETCNKRDDGSWDLSLTCNQPFLDARLFIPWQGAFTSMSSARCRLMSPREGTEALQCYRADKGLLLTGLAFVEDELGVIEPLELRLVEDPQ